MGLRQLSDHPDSQEVLLDTGWTLLILRTQGVPQWEDKEHDLLYHNCITPLLIVN